MGKKIALSIVVLGLLCVILLLVAVWGKRTPSPSLPLAPQAPASSSPTATSTILSLAFPRNIAYGDTGPDVLLLQSLLKSLGYLPPAFLPNGTFDAPTEHALLLFQAGHALNESGFVDLQSQALLDKVAEGLVAGGNASSSSVRPSPPPIPYNPKVPPAVTTSTVANLTPNPPTPPTAFAITGATVSGITDSEVRITVTTNNPASIQVAYGPTTMYGQTTDRTSYLETIYEDLTGLLPHTAYDFRVIATPEGEGAPVYSENYVFVTASSLPPPPVPSPPGNQSHPADTVPPTVQITKPANGASVSGTITILASASDDTGVVKASLYVDTILRLTDQSPPYAFAWNTASLPDGAHAFSVKAYDASGNVGVSPTLTLTTLNAPATLSASLIASPANGLAPLAVSLTATAGGTAQGPVSYTFYCNRADTGTTITPGANLTVLGATSSPYTAKNLCTYAAPGTYTAKVIIGRGNASPAEAEEVVTVAGEPVTPPTITDIAASLVSTSSATISWTTDKPASSQVIYGMTPNYGSSTAVMDDNGVLFHSVTITGLVPNSLYYYSVHAADARGDVAVSPQETFTIGNVVSILSFGGKADGVTDNYQAMQNAAAYLCSHPGYTLVFPPGTYEINGYKISGGSQKNTINDITYTSCHNDTISGYGATIDVFGSFYQSPDYTNGTYWYTYENEISPFSIVNSSDVTIEGFTLNGNVQNMTRGQTPPVAEGVDEGLRTSGSSNLIIKDMDIHHFATDGIYIGAGQNGHADRNIIINNVTSTNNGRVGLGIIQANGVLVENSRFLDGGRTGGNYGYHAPACGVDIEPNYIFPTRIDAVTGNIDFENDTFANNIGFQMVSGVPTGVDRVTVNHTTIEALHSANGFALEPEHGNFTDNTFIMGGQSKVYLQFGGLTSDRMAAIKEIDYTGNSFQLITNQGITSALPTAFAYGSTPVPPIIFDHNAVTVVAANPDPTIMLLANLKQVTNNTFSISMDGWNSRTNAQTVINYNGKATPPIISSNTYETTMSGTKIYKIVYPLEVTGEETYFGNIGP